jgi:hypothetical protein
MAQELTAQSETLQELIGRFRGVRGESAVLPSARNGGRKLAPA